MLFDLEIANIQGANRLIVPLVCTIPRSYGMIRAILDTGSPVTLISGGDVSRLRIPIRDLEDAPSTSGFGRGELPCKKIKRFKFYLKAWENKVINFELPVNAIDISAVSHIQKDLQIKAYTIPTIIGLDFLENLGFKLFIDMKNRVATLENEF